jgi:hypothetical protein
MSVTMGYKMTHDTGFAPNPFHGVLTLATCKPKVRAHRTAGEWVAGFASAALVDRAARKGIQIPLGGLIYLAQISEVLPLDAYFEASEFSLKRPPLESSDAVSMCGDNIYYRDHRGKYEQLHNRHHPPSEAPHDISGINALVARRFYYFGSKCFVPDGGWATLIGAPLSTGRTFFCPAGFAEKLLEYFDARGIAAGMQALPALLEKGSAVHLKPPMMGGGSLLSKPLRQETRSRRSASCGT